MQTFDLNTIKQWERFYRANFINSLTGFKSASLIGTYHTSGIANLGVFSNIVHIGADPALIGFINRPIAAAPHTIQNVELQKHYTINSIHSHFIDKAHKCSAKYPETVSEFAAVGLTEQKIEGINAPFVAESLVKYALELVEIVPIKHNGTFLVIGAVQTVLVDENLLSNDGFLNLNKASTVCSLGIDGYYQPTKLARFSYAKPNTNLVKID
ncbi:MAG: flavin reductase family protein [Chitinophagaceae bacterium]